MPEIYAVDDTPPVPMRSRVAIDERPATGVADEPPGMDLRPAVNNKLVQMPPLPAGSVN